MPEFLVTGGAGFIGSHLVQTLVEQGRSVRVLDNCETGRIENLDPWRDSIELLEQDLCDTGACAQAVDGVDFVLHQAAIPSVPRSVQEPVRTTEVNVMGTVRLLQASADAGVKRFVFAASSSVYGDQDAPKKVETLPTMPLSPYATQKLAGEQFCQHFATYYDLPTVCLRYFNIFGPRQDPNSPYSAVIPLFIRAMAAGEAPDVDGDGLQSRDFTYVANAVRANILATEAPAERVAGKVFNIACGEAFTILDLVARINESLGTQIEPKFRDARAGDVKHSLADIGRATEALGYKVEVDFTEGLRRTIESMQQAAV